jgi:general secretion pathway protein K
MWLNLKSNRSPCGPRDEQGVVLLLVLLILTLISVLVLSWAQEWRTELLLAANFREASQCRRLAEGGVYYALGKLMETKSLEASLATPRGSVETLTLLGASWKGSQESHQIKLPGGLVQVRVEDEGGKVNINQANEIELATLFSAIEVPRERVPAIVDSILDWRTKGDQPRLYGAKSSYYLGLDPPYVARNGPLEAVEELAWVRGFENSPMLPRLSEWLTVMPSSQGVNINSAPLAVLVTRGLPTGVAQSIIRTRQLQPLRNFQDLVQLGVPAQPARVQQMTFTTSPFFTIKSTGMVNKQGGRQTIKAIVRVDLSAQSPWQILSWVDDFPG